MVSLGLRTVSTSVRSGAAPNHDVQGPWPSTVACRTSSGFTGGSVLGPVGAPITVNGVEGVTVREKSSTMTTQGQGLGGTVTASVSWNRPSGVVATSWAAVRSQSSDPWLPWSPQICACTSEDAGKPLPVTETCDPGAAAPG